MYSGMYNGSKKHEPDLDRVLSRAWDAGVEKIFITAGNIEDVRNSAKLAETNGNLLLKKLHKTISMIYLQIAFLQLSVSTPPDVLNLTKSFPRHWNTFKSSRACLTLIKIKSWLWESLAWILRGLSFVILKLRKSI
jgi:Tat protein secretion system quality control protein TatD with DNase activity